MTPRDRILAVLDGEQTDEKPVITWPHEGMQSDAVILPLDRIGVSASKARIMLAEILSPYSRSMAKGLGLNSVLEEDPKRGEELLQDLIKQTKSDFDKAQHAGADGVFYRLQGAEPMHASPMQYGGYYLEADREILAGAWKRSITMLYVEGEEETYLDFVSDLPARIFAWDSRKTGYPVDGMRKLRNGPLATNAPDADILFGSNYGILKQWVKQGGVAANA